jgi:nicotinamidase-related amidase
MINVEPQHSALLVMDLQADIIGRVGEKAAALLETTAGAIANARAAGITVIYVVVGFRPGYPELSPNNAAFATVAQTGRFIVTTPGADIAPAVKPHEGDVVIVKHRVGAFSSTELDLVLRAKGIDTLILSGVATSGVVLSTLRHAADADFRIIVLKDCCADADDEVHRVLTEKVFPRQADVVTAGELSAALSD